MLAWSVAHSVVVDKSITFVVITWSIRTGRTLHPQFRTAQDIWPAAGQISNMLYDRSNFVTGQTRLVMTGHRFN